MTREHPSWFLVVRVRSVACIFGPGRCRLFQVGVRPDGNPTVRRQAVPEVRGPAEAPHLSELALGGVWFLRSA